MADEQFIRSIETGEVQLNKREKLTHYTVVIVFLVITALFAFIYTMKYILGDGKPYKENENLYLFITICILSIISYLFYRLQRRRLKFKITETNLKKEDLILIVKKVGMELKWNIYNYENKFITARTYPGFFSGSYGEYITIIFDKNKVYVNSICDPTGKSSIVSMGRNKKNMNRLIEEIEKSSL